MCLKGVKSALRGLSYSLKTCRGNLVFTDYAFPSFIARPRFNGISALIGLTVLAQWVIESLNIYCIN